MTDTKLLRMKQLPNILSVSKSAIWNWIRNDKFPKPLKINGTSAWRTETIDEWIEEQETQGQEDEVSTTAL